MDEIPYIPSLADLPLSDPKCRNISCNAFYAAYNWSQATLSFYRQFDYGHWLAWYYASFILLAIIAYVGTLYLNELPLEKQRRDAKPSILHKLQAFRRYITYRRLTGPLSDGLGLPSMGMLIFLVVSVAVLFAMAFAIRPYYRERQGYGSPPLAIRTGLMAASLTPLLIALGGKVNLISLMTGIGYEKLNVIHRWVGWSIFGLSVAHTVPFIVAPLRDGGYAQLHENFYQEGSFEYTGIAPLAILFGLVLFSVPWIRHRFYESFYWLHWVLAVSYLGLCFWHFGQEVDSWTYLYATVAIWLFTILGRTFWKNQAFRVDTQWPSWCPSRVSPLAGGVTRIDVYLPLRVSWQPGQHFYLRFPSLSPLDNHPFTICNIPRLSLDKAEDGTLQKATFFARSHSGFTRRLASFAGANVDISEAVWLEGPYGGISRNIARRCDSLILIAGGSGITACLSWLLHCTRAMAAGEASLQRVKLVWIVREREHLAWITGELETARAAINGDERLELIFYITRSSSGGREKTQRLGDAAIKGSKEEMAAAEDGRRPKHHMFKPSIASVLPELLGSGRNMIIGCGPESLKVDIANASAAAQARVWKGETAEVALHTESFGWG